jgi:hypothetical protein
MSISLLSITIIFFACLVAAAIKIRDFFEGETLVRDCIDERMLARTGIERMDEFWAKNPNKSDAIVTLTTIPSRLPHIAATLKSLMRQSRAPARIILNLPDFSKRENAPYTVPAFLQSLKSVQIVRCEDLGPATKVVPTLLREPPERKIIVVDDDRIYPANLVSDLEDAADRDVKSAFGMSGWVVPKDLTDRPTTIYANFRMLAPAPIRARRLRYRVPVDILQGLSGYIVRPCFFDLPRLTDYAGAPPESFFVDDVWISAHCEADRFVIPARRYNYQPKFKSGFYQNTSLGLVNRGIGGDEQRHNSIVLRYLADKWRVGGPSPRLPEPGYKQREADPAI